MYKLVHSDNLTQEERDRLTALRLELEGLQLEPLLRRLMEMYDLSVTQAAASALLQDSSFLYKILRGEHREFKRENVDALLADLQEQKKITSRHETEIWFRAFVIAACLHYESYKIEPRFKSIEDPESRHLALREYLERQYQELANWYDDSGGNFPPLFVPLLDSIARQIQIQWGVETVSENFLIEKNNLFSKEKQAKAQDHIIEPELVRVPAGYFWMGSDDSDKDAWSSEKPQGTRERGPR